MICPGVGGGSHHDYNDDNHDLHDGSGQDIVNSFGQVHF